MLQYRSESIEQGKLSTRTFQKAMNLYLYIPPISAHPTSCFKGLIVGNFLRFRKQNNDENFCQLLANFAKHLLARGHTIKAIKRHFLHAAATTDKSKLQKKQKTKTICSMRKPLQTPTKQSTDRSTYIGATTQQDFSATRSGPSSMQPSKIAILSRKE